MKRLESKPVTAWLILIALTALSLVFAESHSVVSAIIPIIFAFAAMKSILVMLCFMEINRARKRWKMLYSGWLAVVTVVLVVGNMW